MHIRMEAGTKKHIVNQFALQGVDLCRFYNESF